MGEKSLIGPKVAQGSFVVWGALGAGLQQNEGKQWEPESWEKMTTLPPNPVFTDAAERSSKRWLSDKKRKATDWVKAKRRKSKYTRIDNTAAARRAYSRHDGGVLPEESDDDVSPDHLKQLKDGFYKTKVAVTPEEAKTIEKQTSDQADNEEWMMERRKRITASNLGWEPLQNEVRKYNNYSTTPFEETRPLVMAQKRKTKHDNSTLLTWSR